MTLGFGSFQSKTQTKKIRQIQHLHSTFTKDIALLQKQLEERKKKASYLFLEAQHHQLQLLAESPNHSVLGNSKVLNLKDVYLNTMDRKLETQQMVSFIGVTSLRANVNRVADMDEDPALPPPPHKHPRRKKQQQEEEDDDTRPERGVFKLFHMEGTIGETAYATAFVVRNNLGQEAGKAVDLQDIRLGTHDTIAKQMLTVVRLNLPETVHYFTSDLSYYKVLRDERQEALDQLESEMPGVEEIEHSEPAVLHLLNHGQHEVVVVWGLYWDEPNCIFKYNISVQCTSEVATRYSRSDLYSYLTSQRKLKTQEDVITFIETFTGL